MHLSNEEIEQGNRVKLAVAAVFEERRRFGSVEKELLASLEHEISALQKLGGRIYGELYSTRLSTPFELHEMEIGFYKQLDAGEPQPAAENGADADG